MFWRRTPLAPEQDPTLPITLSPLSGRRPSEPYLLTMPVEAHPPSLPPKDHLRETYRPGPEYDEQVGVARGRVGAETGSGSEVMRERQCEQEGSWIDCNGVIQIGPIVRERSRSSQEYQPTPRLDRSCSFILPTLPSSPKPDSEPNESPPGRLKESQYLEDNQTAEVSSYLQEPGCSNIAHIRENQDVLLPSSTKALGFREIDQVSLNSRPKDEEEILTFLSSTTTTRPHDTSCPRIELKLSSEGFSIDWSSIFE